jgi:hypothetical protein
MKEKYSLVVVLAVILALFLVMGILQACDDDDDDDDIEDQIKGAIASGSMPPTTATPSGNATPAPGTVPIVPPPPKNQFKPG